MTVPPGTPERQSLYADPHRAGAWEPTVPTRPSRMWVIPVAAAGVAIVGLAISFGIALGHRIGTSDVVVDDPDGQEINALQVDVGTCITDLPNDGRVARVTAVPCDVAHVGEAVATYPVAGDEWPGRGAVVSEVLGYCGSVIQPGPAGSGMFQASDWGAGLRWVAWVPTEESWADGERAGVCVAYREAGVQGSFVAATATFVN